LSIVNPEAAATPFVLAIDVGSSSVRALLFDGRGHQVSGTEHQITYSLETTPEGGSTTDPDQLVHLVSRCIDTTLQASGDHAGAIEAVGITTFWHSLLGLDGEMRPTTPLLMWADTRSNEDARALEAAYPETDVHRVTGCRFHSSYWPAKLRWLERTEDSRFRRTAHSVSFADYLAWTLHGGLLTSISMASGTGMLDAETMTWHDEVVAIASIRADQLPAIIDRDTPLPPLRPAWRERWPQLAGARWFPAIGDGATANLGTYCAGPDRIALTIGTSGAMRIVVDAERDAPVVPELWRYRLDRHSIVVGGALSNGGNIMSWLAGLAGDHDFDALMADARTVAPDGHGLTVLPLLAGERSPSWDDRFGGTISGLRLDTTAGDLFRAFLEATAYRFAAIYDGLKPLAAPEHDIHAGGGAVLRSPLWMQILADTLGHELFALDPGAEASARGAAICALQAIGAIPSIRLDPGSGLEFHSPDADRHRAYAAGRRRQARLEAAIRSMGDAAP
jgi:gluconokinase